MPVSLPVGFVNVPVTITNGLNMVSLFAGAAIWMLIGAVSVMVTLAAAAPQGPVACSKVRCAKFNGFQRCCGSVSEVVDGVKFIDKI